MQLPGGVRLSRPARIALLALTVWLVALVVGAPAGAHSFLRSSDPAASAVLPVAPNRVTLTFAEPLESSYTKAELFDASGTAIPGTTFGIDQTDRHSLILDLPTGLPNGTYSVVWRTLSSADGHRARGYLPLTFGTAADIRSVVPPTADDAGSPPGWLGTLARVIALAGLAGAVAAWPVWLLVLRPAIAPAWQAGAELARRARRLAIAAALIGLAGSLLGLIVQAWAASADDGFLTALRTTLFETRWGRWWMVRALLLAAFATAASGAPWWRPRWRPWLTAGLAALSLSLALPFSMVAHAAAQTRGRQAAVAFDAFHIVAASLWVGGIAALVIGLLPTLRDLTPAGRRVVVARAASRFSAVALVAWVMLAVTGVHNGWLQVGSLDGLRSTDYGRSLAVKLGLIALILPFAAFNLLLLRRGLERSGDDGRSWVRRFGVAIAVELVLGGLVLLVAARLVAQPPARDELFQDANQRAVAIDLGGRPATLTLAPGAVGPNHYRLDIAGEPLPENAEALIRLTPPRVETGEEEIELARSGAGTFEWHGSELSFAGDWAATVIVRSVGAFQHEAAVTLAVPAVAPGAESTEPPRFDTAAIGGLLLLAAGLAALALAWRAGRGSLRREAGGLGAVAAAVGVLLLVTARMPAPSAIALDTRNPIPADSPSIARGEATYLANCTECHGVTGRGDGPLAMSFSPPAADFTTVHAKLHLDAEFFNWIKNGKPPTAMPPWADTLSDADIWDVINYLRSLQAGAPDAATPPAAPVATPAPTP
jgi:copper transport protein